MEETMSSSPTPSDISTKNSSKSTTIILLVVFGLLFLLGVIGVGGYFAYKYFLSDLDVSEDESSSDDSEEVSEECNNLWWFDDSSVDCQQDEFCGLYMYESLETFETEEECLESLPESEEEEVLGSISGAVGYPSEFIPEDMFVCAEDTASTEEYCTEDIIYDDPQFTTHVGYLIEVPYGTYNIYAQLPGDEYKAYYSEYVPCGMSIECDSHDPLDVTVDEVTPNQTDIDATDWYAEL
ncbi:MAG: hypothetical protein ABIC57_03070 [bacterium]